MVAGGACTNRSFKGIGRPHVCSLATQIEGQMAEVRRKRNIGIERKIEKPDIVKKQRREDILNVNFGNNP